MKAIRVHAYGPPEQLVHDEVSDPAPGPGEVVVAVNAAGVNPADYKFRSGMLAAAVPRLPFVPGMDIAGSIAAVGEGVSDWRVGDRVLAMLYLMGNGGYQERVAVPADWCGATPAGLDDRLAAALPTPGLTAVQWIEEGLAVHGDTRLLVTGAVGAVGLIACHAAKQRGAHVTAAVRRAQAGNVRYADAVLVLDEGELPQPGSFDCIADTVGGETAERMLPGLKPGGVLSTVATDPVTNPQGLDVEIAFFGNHPDGARLAQLAAAVAAGDLRVAEPRILPLSEAAKAHELLEAGGAGKIVLVPDRLL
jgi:NADPH:quinone reductase-like Zn-dependent oxidoreductase